MLDKDREDGEGWSGGCLTARAAAETLRRACEQALEPAPGHAKPGESGENGGRLRLYLDSVSELAGELDRELAALSGISGAAESPETDGPAADQASALLSAALRAADLATLAACTLPELPEQSPEYLRAAAATHLAAAAARSLALEHGALREPGESGENETRDLQGAGWRADLAVRQIEQTGETDQST